MGAEGELLWSGEPPHPILGASALMCSGDEVRVEAPEAEVALASLLVTSWLQGRVWREVRWLGSHPVRGAREGGMSLQLGRWLRPFLETQKHPDSRSWCRGVEVLFPEPQLVTAAPAPTSADGSWS